MINEEEGTETTTVETASEMSQTELETYLSGNDKVEEGEEKIETKPAIEESPFKMGETKDETEKVIDGDIDSKKVPVEEEEKKEEEVKTGEVKTEEDETFTNMVDYLNKEHELGLNTENLPSDLSREQEAEVVSDLFQRTLTGVNRKLEEYSNIEEILKDKEVKDFIAAKAEGKTLKDYVQTFSESLDGQNSESIIRNQLSTQYSDMTKEEISDMIEVYKDKGILDKMADSARESQKVDIKQKEEVETATQKATLDGEIQKFGSFVGGTESVYGIPLNDQIKKDVFVAVTQRGEDNLTYMDKVLESDEGMFLAALGVLHMQELMKARASTDTNRRNKSLVDKLFDKASDLQSSASDDTKEEAFNAEIADRF